MTEIVIDTKPYCPDIFFENNSYKINNVVSNEKINASSNIFIVNINNTNSIYSDPEYMLYGNYESLIQDGSITNKDELSGTYFSPSYFFKMETSQKIIVVLESNELSDKYKNLLKNIGYLTDNDEISSFIYKELIVFDSVSKSKRNVIFIYFVYAKFGSDEQVFSFNDFNSTIFYEHENKNVIIYPFINDPPNFCVQDAFFNYHFKDNFKNVVRLIDFDDRENISFDKKIDFKYFENKKIKTKLSSLANYSYYMKNNAVFLEKQLDSNKILISLNEIGKIYNKKESQNNNSISTLINKNYVNKYSSYSSSNNKYLMSFDAKTNYSNKLKNKNNMKHNIGWKQNQPKQFPQGLGIILIALLFMTSQPIIEFVANLI